ncbi:pollen-specific leucine-rich repeat extensin-like protein 2 [Lathyrus oleraceus]|uniref:pollen-specific leucine-rich repeat extensin-like protein 2 n=1 Tax=Pisum sativum TaxID=3888 RepID=UPI0021D13D2A|nr:pollen-specific leucine-rich repeat extensin-like protein 2 [Pisum sativum]
MTKRGGKAKVLAPGKLQEERNRIINKKHIVRKPAQTTLSMQDASSAPTPAQAAPSVQVASSMPTSASKKSSVQAASSMPTPAQEASSVQVASSMPTSASKKSCVQAASLMPTPAQAASSVQDASSMPTPAQAASSVQAASSMPTPAPTVVPVHATTSEKFSFMPTPTLSHQTMAGPQSINLQTMASPSIWQRRKMWMLMRMRRLVPAKEVAGAINYAIRKQFYKPIHHWSALDPDMKADWFKLFGEKVSWDPFDHAFVYSAFEKKEEND